ncbi:unnamed protein product [Paramecium primaurelia]|uniref:Uncharacterized protein n=1 Tax=Paramecium primaurelia TaxID=5886 RepID=A0A8S1M3Y9_PARPR|nr:unnamed protein product [Paramecium primaurelia]
MNRNNNNCLHNKKYNNQLKGLIYKIFTKLNNTIYRKIKNFQIKLNLIQILEEIFYLSQTNKILKIQNILVQYNRFQYNYQPIFFLNEIQTINQQYYPSDIGTSIIRQVINSDFGSTQIHRNREALNTEIQDKIEQYQLSNEEQSVGEIKQNRGVQQQQGIEYTFQIQTSLQEQTYQERDQQSLDYFKNNRVHNFKLNDQVVQSFNESEKEDILNHQQLEQIINNHRSKGSDIQNNQQRKRKQEICCNIRQSLFD